MLNDGDVEAFRANLKKIFSKQKTFMSRKTRGCSFAPLDLIDPSLSLSDQGFVCAVGMSAIADLRW